MRSLELCLNIPDMVNFSERDLKIMLASKLYEIRELSLGQAAVVAGLSKRAFIEVLGQYDVSLFNSNEAELREDIANA